MPIIKEHVYTYWVVIITKDISSHHEDKLTTYPMQIAQFRFYFQVTIVQNQWDRFVGQLNPNSRLPIVNREW